MASPNRGAMPTRTIAKRPANVKNKKVQRAVSRKNERPMSSKGMIVNTGPMGQFGGAGGMGGGGAGGGGM